MQQFDLIRNRIGNNSEKSLNNTQRLLKDLEVGTRSTTPDCPRRGSWRSREAENYFLSSLLSHSGSNLPAVQPSFFLFSVELNEARATQPNHLIYRMLRWDLVADNKSMIWPTGTHGGFGIELGPILKNPLIFCFTSTEMLTVWEKRRWLIWKEKPKPWWSQQCWFLRYCLV